MELMQIYEISMTVTHFIIWYQMPQISILLLKYLKNYCNMESKLTALISLADHLFSIVLSKSRLINNKIINYKETMIKWRYYKLCLIVNQLIWTLLMCIRKLLCIMPVRKSSSFLYCIFLIRTLIMMPKIQKEIHP